MFFIFVFLLSISMIFLQLKDRAESEKINADLEEIYYGKQDEEDKSNKENIEENEGEKISPIKLVEENLIGLDEFKDLLEKNKNTVAWLKIDNTRIDYPVLQADDNEFYLNHDFNDKLNQQGSIFMDFRNRIDLDDNHTILYGHHMKNGTMFKDLNLFKSEEFFKANKTFKMKSLYREYTYEIFSAHVDKNDPYIIKTRFNNDEFTSFIKTLQEKSEYKTEVDVGDRDRILTLITCTYDFKDARYIVHAKRVN